MKIKRLVNKWKVEGNGEVFSAHQLTNFLNDSIANLGGYSGFMLFGNRIQEHAIMANGFDVLAMQSTTHLSVEKVMAVWRDFQNLVVAVREFVGGE